MVFNWKNVSVAVLIVSLVAGCSDDGAGTPAPETIKTAETESATPAPETVNNPLPVATETVVSDVAPTDGVLVTGAWVKKKQVSGGKWLIVRENGALFVELDADFETRGAPDLKLFLSPLSAAEVNKDNAVDGALLISPLESNSGAQRYPIPADTELAAFQSIIIHCEQYTVLWSAADL